MGADACGLAGGAAARGGEVRIVGKRPSQEEEREAMGSWWWRLAAMVIVRGWVGWW